MKSVPVRAAVAALLLALPVSAALPGAAFGATAKAASPAPAAPSTDMIDRPAARLQALDKVTAHTTSFDIQVGETRQFGSLRVTLRACRQNPPIAVPESAAFLEIVEVKPGEQAETVFSGWMFASSPALSAMEHPVYDVWVLSCLEK